MKEYPHLLKIQVVMGLLVAIGGYVLGNSIDDMNIVIVTFIGTLMAFIFVDRLKMIELSGWTANVVLVLILIYSMRDFVGGDSTVKLTAVANMLSYLLVALFFQKKTPRLGWQLLVLSILQMLEASIFNLNFEYGIFFVFYFALSSFALILQNDYLEWTRAQRNNKRFSDSTKSTNFAVALPATLNSSVMHRSAPVSRNLLDYAKLLAPWLAGSLLFSFILFHSLPHTKQDWKGPTQSEFTATGKSKSVNLNYEGIVRLTNELVFRAKFLDPRSNEKVVIVGQPYFRGMALSKWNLENGITNWQAPYDHVFDWSYRKLPGFVRNTNPFEESLAENNSKEQSAREKEFVKKMADSIETPLYIGDARKVSNHVRHIKLEIVLEPDRDPLLYTTMPVYRPVEGETRVNFCQELSALTRIKSNTANSITSFKYDTTTLVDQYSRLLNAHPYRTPDSRQNFREMESGSPEFRLLTEMDAERYPNLVEIANDIGQKYSNATQLGLATALLGHFTQSNGYSYTLDYRNIEKKLGVDPVEDFVANHRSGHCTLFASALTLMLRSAGIPARYIVGFHGGNYNSLTDSYVIHGRHAHAWVEAYIPAEDCTQEMINKGMADKDGGAWLTLDPTPPTTDRSSNEALDLARSLWQDYVISPDHNKQDLNNANSVLLSGGSDTFFGRSVKNAMETITANRWMQILLILATVGLILMPHARRNAGREKGENKSSRGTVRNFLARAASFFSPRLAELVGGNPTRKVVFYEKFERMLKRHLDLERMPDQTQLEFANLASTRIARQVADPTDWKPVENICQQVTNAFYQARFSSIPLDKVAVDDIENQILNLDKILNKTKT